MSNSAIVIRILCFDIFLLAVTLIFRGRVKSSSLENNKGPHELEKWGGKIMRYRTLGKSGIQASVVGMEVWVGEDWSRDGEEEKNMIDAIQAGIDIGINLIDTAPIYGLGHSEQIVGKAIAGKRDKVVLGTKCGLVWDTNKGKHIFEERGVPVNRYLGEESIRFEVEQSLRRLGTDYLDLYQILINDLDRPIEEPIDTLYNLKKEGKIRAIGVCDVTLGQLEMYHRDGEVDTVQQQYSPIDRRAEMDILPYCFNHGISVLAYSHLIQGLLLGKLGPGIKYSGDAIRGDWSFTSEDLQTVADMFSDFNQIASRYNIDIPQLSIAWTAQSPGVSHVLVGTLNADQAIVAAGAGDASLSEEVVEEINRMIETNLLQIGQTVRA